MRGVQFAQVAGRLPGVHSDSAFAFEEVYDADVQALTGPAEMSDATRLKDVYVVDDWHDDAADGGTHVWTSGAGLGVTAGVCGGLCEDFEGRYYRSMRSLRSSMSRL